MAELHGRSAEKVVAFFMLRIVSGVSVHHTHAVHVPIEIRVEHSCLLCLVPPVENLQHIPTYEFVISVKTYDY